MGYIPGGGRLLTEILDASAEREELDLPQGVFVAQIGKAYIFALIIAAVICLAIGIPTAFVWNEEAGFVFLVLGILALLVLPTIISYRCVVNKIVLKEEYFVLFIRLKKEVLWESVKYRKLSSGNNSSIKLYDANMKRLISFDSGTVGFSRIVKLSKRSSIKNLNI